ncbi:hypothetical protein [Macrococcoides caseolyticum]|uniref:hypothetical protein n=1 Tax=Macrococcoides caseolyticum TaxID=69966 RepID=UPI000C348300|nr:hypothetical protein [Macrococcus caseolyticus]PKE51624.1 hypothetical protein CW672_00555 [Macrococcus caseolyticus]PKE73097.1 hypothetical protein CW665_01310 [Macrococcus caseolyticus]PKF41518.1 hypothetical protein CW661_03820 [Macrococcus caseolyticus]
MDKLISLKLEFLTGLRIIKSNNSMDVILSNITIWKEVLQIVGVEERHYMEAYQELLDELEENPKHIETFWEDFETCVQHLESMVERYKKDDLSINERSYLWANMTLPVLLLAVMWIYNHTEFNGDLYEFSETEHFEPMREVLS